MRYIIVTLLIVLSIYLTLSCSGGGGGELPGPIPTFDTTWNTFPTTTTNTFPTTTITTTNTTTTTTNTTTNNQNHKYLYVKVLRKVGNDIQWLGYDWNQDAYIHFNANNPYNNKTVYVNDGYYGTNTLFKYDTYYVDYVSIGVYYYYYGYDYKVYIGNTYQTSQEAWYGQFTVDYYNPYGSSIYIVFNDGVTPNILNRNTSKPKSKK